MVRKSTLRSMETTAVGFAKVHRLRIRQVAWFGIRLLTAVACVCFAWKASGGISKPDAANDLRNDSRLSVAVTMTGRYETLQSCFDRIRGFTGVGLHVSGEVAGRRITYRMRDKPLRTLMDSLATIAHAQWREIEIRKSSDSTQSVYQLCQTPEQASRDRALERDAQRREEADSAAVRNMILGILGEALASRNPDRPSVADLLAGLGPDDVDAIAEAATAPVSTIAADNQGHFHDHLALATPFGDLSPSAQKSVRAMVTRPEYGADGAKPVFVPAVAGEQDLAKSDIGLVSFEGGVHLAVVGPDGKDVWVSPTDFIRARPVPGVSRDDDMDPLYVVPPRPSLNGLPPSTLKKRIRVLPTTRRTMADLLDAIAVQADMDFVADDFLRTRTTPYSWVFTDKLDYSVAQAMDQLSLTFDHAITTRDGVVEVVTAARGADLRADPPPALFVRMSALAKAKRPMVFSDYLELGILSRNQLHTLISARPFDGAFSTVFLRVERTYLAFGIYAPLSPEHRRAAESQEGLSLTDMPPNIAAAFKHMLRIGMPCPGPAIQSSLVPRFYAVRQLRPGNASVPGPPDGMTFLVVGGGNKARATCCSISFH